MRMTFPHICSSCELLGPLGLCLIHLLRANPSNIYSWLCISLHFLFSSLNISCCFHFPSCDVVSGLQTPLGMCSGWFRGLGTRWVLAPWIVALIDMTLSLAWRVHVYCAREVLAPRQALAQKCTHLAVN